jgi:transposase
MEKDMANRKRDEVEVIYPNAAGIDVGSASHWVAVPADRDEQPVREFRSFTAELNALADWLDGCRIETVVMESTGVYWIPLFELLESRGFQVFLADARRVKNVPGRKSDFLDCQWLQRLMSFGLLSGAFRPTESVCALRAVVRTRDSILKGQARCVQHMQKALTQMNLQLTKVVSDVTGVTGLAIVRAIVAGERDPNALAKLRHPRLRAEVAEVAAALHGNWREEHLFALSEALALYDSHQASLDRCDRQIEQMLTRLQQYSNETCQSKRKCARLKLDIHALLVGLCGVDLTRIDGLDTTTALKVLSEVGWDLSRFPSDKHFASWLGLCPGTRKSGGKELSAASKRSANRAAQALRVAASCLKRSKSALGAYYRRLCARMDKPSAITATAHKLSRLIYAMLTKGVEYVDKGQDYYEERYRQRALHNLKRRARQFGYALVIQKDDSPATTISALPAVS